MSLIPPADERRKSGDGPSPYFSSLLGLFGGILAWLTASTLLLKPFLEPLLGAPGADGTWTSEQMESAQRELAARPYGPLLFVAPHLVFVVVACTLAFLSRVSFRNRLALQPLRLAPGTLLLVALGMLGVQGLVVSLAPLLGEPSDQLQFLSELVRRPEPARALGVGALLVLVPAFCEELFFRGYVQSRLVAVWPPGAAVLLTSAVFALVHIDAQHMLGVLPIGVYLGWIAWRSGTVWASMLLHALNNLTAVLLERFAGEGLSAWALWSATAALLGAGFVGARRLMHEPATAETMRLSCEGLAPPPGDGSASRA